MAITNPVIHVFSSFDKEKQGTHLIYHVLINLRNFCITEQMSLLHKYALEKTAEFQTCLENPFHPLTSKKLKQ